MNTIYTVPTDTSKEKRVKLLRKIFKRPKEGVECMFVQLTKTVGMKIYNNSRDAYKSRSKQFSAWEIGIAPKVLSIVKKCDTSNLLKYDNQGVLDNNDFVGYFYMTQVAKTPAGYCKVKETCRLYDKLESIGFSSDDTHSGNLGRIGKKLVMIDFGDMST